MTFFHLFKPKYIFAVKATNRIASKCSNFTLQMAFEKIKRATRNLGKRIFGDLGIFKPKNLLALMAKQPTSSILNFLNFYCG